VIAPLTAGRRRTNFFVLRVCTHARLFGLYTLTTPTLRVNIVGMSCYRILLPVFRAACCTRKITFVSRVPAPSVPRVSNATCRVTSVIPQTTQSALVMYYELLWMDLMKPSAFRCHDWTDEELIRSWEFNKWKYYGLQWMFCSDTFAELWALSTVPITGLEIGLGPAYFADFTQLHFHCRFPISMHSYRPDHCGTNYVYIRRTRV